MLAMNCKKIYRLKCILYFIFFFFVLIRLLLMVRVKLTEMNRAWYENVEERGVSEHSLWKYLIAIATLATSGVASCLREKVIGPELVKNRLL